MKQIIMVLSVVIFVTGCGTSAVNDDEKTRHFEKRIERLEKEVEQLHKQLDDLRPDGYLELN